MYLYAQTAPYLLLTNSGPIFFSSCQDMLSPKISDFFSGERLNNEWVRILYYLICIDNITSFIYSPHLIAIEPIIVMLLLNLEPYYNDIFHIEHKNYYLSFYVDLVIIDCYTRLQWVNMNPFLLSYQNEAYLNSYSFSGTSRYDFISVEGYDLLSNCCSFYFICDGDYSNYLIYNEDDYIFQFSKLGYKNRIKLNFIEHEGNVCIYSQEFGYLQVGYEEELSIYFPVFSKEYLLYTIVLEQTKLYSSYYLKHDYMYVQLVKHEGISFGILTDNIEDASIFQIITEC